MGNQAGQRQQRNQGALQVPEADPMGKFSLDQLQYFAQAAAGHAAAAADPTLNGGDAAQRLKVQSG
jgi:hypothetical protein